MVVKLDPLGNEKYTTRARLSHARPLRGLSKLHGRFQHAIWAMHVLSPVNLFTEYYYVDRWFNIFDIRAQMVLAKAVLQHSRTSDNLQITSSSRPAAGCMGKPGR